MNKDTSSPILCISDLHGNIGLLLKALKTGLERAGRDDLDVVLLGDYCDNGTEVRELLEYLSTEQWRQTYPNITLQCIAGNNDVALLLAHSPAEFHNNPDPMSNRRGAWWDRSTRWFCINDEGQTIRQYGAKTHAEFVDRFPPHHFEFLRSLPWSLSIAQYIFVHAGLRPAAEESVASQLEFLKKKDLSDLSRHVYARGGYGLPDQLSNKEWARLNDPCWGHVIVTGHNKYTRRGDGKEKRSKQCKGGEDVPDFVASHRIGFHSCSCQLLLNPALSLHCALLPRATPDAALQFDQAGEAVTESCWARCTTDVAPPDFFSVSHCLRGEAEKDEDNQEKSPPPNQSDHANRKTNAVKTMDEECSKDVFMESDSSTVLSFSSLFA